MTDSNSRLRSLVAVRPHPGDPLQDWPCARCRTELRRFVRRHKPDGVVVRFCRGHRCATATWYRNGRRTAMSCIPDADPAHWADLAGEWTLIPATPDTAHRDPA